jgi:endoglucanase
VQLSDPGSNFGSASVLFSATNATAWYNDDSYLKFDVSGVSSVTSAKLRVRAALTSTSEGALTMAVYPVADTSWAEGAINWSNKPARGSSPLASVSVGTDSYVVYELDVTSYVAAQKAAGQPLVSFALHDPSATNARVLMQSKESGSGPALVVAR